MLAFLDALVKAHNGSVCSLHRYLPCCQSAISRYRLRLMDDDALLKMKTDAHKWHTKPLTDL